ncbi:hypothetical protein [Sediminivirga luteola]|uniref:Uncharacterized protein n=1 Tax=Sediminivirga luteola TaxID=1774748 RepID=A0A8J2TZ49_9MICO|nr:hypothetical protein [Sediminivirga luteola]GGA18869.1 hypothetical protein GCM10011333_22510 [Sediminivirga luteola]
MAQQPDRTLPAGAAVSTGTTGVPARHRNLWNRLVPPSGPAETVQGEALRIAGNIHDGLARHGRADHDHDCRAMLRELPAYLALGTTLPAEEFTEARRIAEALRTGRPAPAERLSDLVARWIARNPAPIPLARPPYRR